MGIYGIKDFEYEIKLSVRNTTWLNKISSKLDETFRKIEYNLLTDIRYVHIQKIDYGI